MGKPILNNHILLLFGQRATMPGGGELQNIMVGLVNAHPQALEPVTEARLLALPKVFRDLAPGDFQNPFKRVALDRGVHAHGAVLDDGE